MNEQRINFRVGLFILIALFFGVTLVVVIGKESETFSAKTDYVSLHESADGLRPGNPVFVAGVRAGVVKSVALQDDGLVRVEFDVVSRSAHLVRGEPNAEHPHRVKRGEPRGSMAVIGGQGLLGDKALEITVGHASLPPWPSEIPLPAKPTSDLFAEAEAVVVEVKHTVENLRRVTDPLAEQGFGDDLKRIAENLATISESWAEGDGTVQRLLKDPALADSVTRTVSELEKTTASIRGASQRVEAILREIERGDGSVHKLIYGTELIDTVAAFGAVGEEIAHALQGVRESDSLVNELLYGDDQGNLLANLNAASADIAAITSEIRAGKGTIGGLVVDPSIYEDVKRLLGDLTRNEILRALVRYSIKRDEQATALPEPE